ncbi:HAD family hydrolase [Kitasatospora fiedleri]|uniref:HAD family hydrolase n=1 Tax=Kitasatospora fiedleri TaxID=2991545 RepID=UPI00249C22CC|nr:HAD-IB family hydrolase [Kitasatospora fiedleri]
MPLTLAPAEAPTAVAAPMAFFDVDETLIAVKSMFSFLRFHLERRGERPETYDALVGQLHADAAAGTPRHEINRRYYRLFAGERAAELAASGRAWFEDALRGAAEAGGSLLLAEPVAHLRAHRARGTAVVLLSGSFFACLDPVAELLGADGALGTRPIVRRGELTGEVVGPMIGGRKARAAAAAAWLRGADLDACLAYGDHASDLPLLEAVGRGLVVGADPVLAEAARTHGWQFLDAAPGH